MKKLYYLGPEDSFSHVSAEKFPDKQNYKLIPCDNFQEIIKYVLLDNKSIGVLPIENSITSDIHENIDYLFKYKLNIVYEAYLRIELHLLSTVNAKLEEIRTIYSHPKALEQCSIFIASHNIDTIETSSTSVSKQLILTKNDLTVGIIGGKNLADKKIKILNENIGNDKINLSRFVFVSRQVPELKTLKNKASITFKVKHAPGSLAKLLDNIAQHKLNITKIESRPIPGTNWEYQFWIDIENSKSNFNLNQIKDLFQKNTLNFNIIGVYAKGKIYQT